MTTSPSVQADRPNILTIAGSDSGGGAGIQADLKTIAVLGGYGLSVITALTAQNGLGVRGVHAPPADFVLAQLEAIREGFVVRAAKTGMLFSREIITALAGALKGKDFPLVVDPVCVSQSGHALLEDDAIEALVTTFLPLADLLTPNLPEAERLCGRSIRGPEDIPGALAALLDLGPKAVLLKGGHFPVAQPSAHITDWLALPGCEPVPLAHPRIETRNTHGTGCTLSAAIACGLGAGLPLTEAVQRAQRYLSFCLSKGYAPGLGFGPPDHFAPCYDDRSEIDC